MTDWEHLTIAVNHIQARANLRHGTEIVIRCQSRGDIFKLKQDYLYCLGKGQVLMGDDPRLTDVFPMNGIVLRFEERA